MIDFFDNTGERSYSPKAESIQTIQSLKSLGRSFSMSVN